MSVESYWLAFGLLGQGIFSARFIVQWMVSEKKQRSVIPIVFWYLSLLGGISLLFYSIHKRDPVFILGQMSGIFIYSRNLCLVYREQRAPSLRPHVGEGS
jgi:lipid-A-disaccharide synthase-like uncharacterized protein